MTDTVSDNMVVIFNFTLKNRAGEVLDESGSQPMASLQGAENVVPGLEKAFVGKRLGDSFDVEVAPEDGYGPVSGPGPRGLSRDSFPDDVDIAAGMAFMAENERGEPMPLWVTDVKGDTVFIDSNHPLAGKTLFFSVEIVGIRRANEEELHHGHPHGIDGKSGHHHHH